MTNDVPMKLAKSLAILGYGLQAVSRERSYLEENTIVSAEFNLYRTNDERVRLSIPQKSLFIQKTSKNLPKSTPTRLSNS
jgi:hypothetical protein